MSVYDATVGACGVGCAPAAFPYGYSAAAYPVVNPVYTSTAVVPYGGYGGYGGYGNLSIIGQADAPVTNPNADPNAQPGVWQNIKNFGEKETIPGIKNKWTGLALAGLGLTYYGYKKRWFK